METKSVPRLSGVTVFFHVFLPFALGHYLSSLLRNVNAVLAPHLVGELALTSGQLGLLTSAFFFTFALAQLPIGIALDRYGPRRVQFALLLLAATGVMLFGSGHTFTQLVVARAIIGGGLGGCFMSAVKAMSMWVAPARLPSVQGYLIAAGGLGAASATMPVRRILEHTDWHTLFNMLGMLTACTAVLIWLVTPRARGTGGPPPSVRSVLDVFRAPAFRQTISLVLVPHAVFFGIQGLWIGRWLSDVAHFPDSAVAYLLYMGMASVIFGAIAVGMITEWAGRRSIATLDVAAIGVALFVLVQVVMVCSWRPSLQLLSVLFVLVGTVTGIEYAVIAQNLPRELMGRAATCLNLLIFIGAFFVQAGFGQIVGVWQPDFAGHYPAVAYQVGFGVLALVQMPGLLKYGLRRRPVKCGIAVLTLKEEYEIGPLRSPR